MASGYEIGKLVWAITGDTSGIDQSLKQTEAKAKNTGTSLISMIKGAFGAYALYDIGKKALQNAASIETQTVAFTTMLGSAERAKSLMKELSDFAASTPFELPEIVQAGKSLIAFGESADTVRSTLSRIGDVAAGLSIPLNELVQIYGKARTQNTLYAEDLNQLAGRGIPIFDELGKLLDVDASQVKKLGSEGKITFKQLEQVFVNLTSTGGKFGGLMKSQSETLNGLWSNFNDNLNRSLGLIGDGLLPASKEWLTLANNILNVISNTDARFPKINSALLSILAPVKALWDYNTKIAEILNKYLFFSEEIGKSEDERGKLNAQDLEIYKTKGVIAEKELKTQKATTDQIKAWVRERKSLIAETAQFNEEYGKSETELIKAEFIERQKAFKRYNLTSQEDISALADYAIATNERIKVAEQKQLADRLNNYNSYAQQVGGAITGLLSAFQSLSQARYQADIDALDAQLEAELEAAGVSEQTTVEQAQKEYDLAVATGDALLIEDKRKALEKAKIEEKYQKKKAELEYKAAYTSWQFQRAIAAAQIPLAIMNAVASGAQAPWFLQPGFMIAMGTIAGITAGAQFAAVEAAEPQPPKFATGGIIPGSQQGTRIIAGENNQTEVVMNPSQMANTLMSIANGGSGGGAQFAQVPPMSEASLWKMIYEASQNGDLFIAQKAVTNR